ncbi:peptidase domain-containing ABC transporter [Leptothermofonsia sp. ETS-13]|uniref:peptidase domain-containing ABC transporter n=1 Tax=Leptothermofonsia sp. ETS-13 TaxID=3035696 RepID=UPI003BA083F3
MKQVFNSLSKFVSNLGLQYLPRKQNKRMKYAVFLQQNEEDCGAACLGSIAKHYGLTLTLTRLREAVGTGQQGTTLLGLKRGAEKLGFNARSVRASAQILEQINEAPLPAIIHWMGNHWVVLYGQEKQKYVIVDPAIGERYLSEEELREGWIDWTMLLLEPDPARFFAQSSDEPTRGISSFVQRIWLYRSLLAEVLLINGLLGLLSIATPFLIQILTDDVLIRGDLRLLNGLAIGVIVLNLFSSGLELVQANLIAYFAQRLELGLVLEFGRSILRLPLNYYETRRSGEVVSRLRDIQDLNQLVSQVVVSLPSQIFIAIVSLMLMLIFSWKLTLVALFIALLMTISTVVFLPTLQQKTRSLLVLEAENQGVLVETFKGALTLKTTTATNQFWEEFQSRFGRLANLALRTTQIGIINNTFSDLVSAIGAVVLLWFGSSLVISQELSIGQLLAFASFNTNVTTLIGTVVKFTDEFARVRTASQRLNEVIEHPTETQGDAAKPFVRIPPDAEIECDRLTFHYPGRVDLLDDFSLRLPGGGVIALIGKSGCGKSTLAKLIAGLYMLQSGNIRIGGYNLQDLSLECLRRQVVLVPQDAHFWSRSILENFRLGTPDVSFEEIVHVCQVTGADEFISRLPEKYQTILGEFGANLSGGQRQRLAIARALINDPPILILDESTAGLDPVSEAEVLDQLLYYRQGRTTILISHRPRVINRADWIVLLDQGKLVTQGSLKDLQSQLGEHLDFLTP